MMTKEAFREQFFALVEKGEHIVITSHVSPDDDSIGSVLAMRAILSEKYPSKDISIIYTGLPVVRYSVFENFDKIKWVDDIANHLQGVDTLITLDASNWRRFSKNEVALAAVPVRIGIDHHASTPDEYTLLFKDEAAVSNTELLYQIFLEGSEYTKNLAEYIFLGILGDTGGFSHIDAHSSNIFLIAKELLDRIEMSIDGFRSRYMGIPFRIIPLLQELVKNTTYITIEGWPPLQYSYLESMGKYSDEDMSAASHIYMSQYLTRVEGYSWGFVLTPRLDATCRMSGRSLEGSVDVRTFHESLGIGSGHIHAAGGYWTQPDPKVCAQKVLEFMQNNRPVLS